MSLPKFRYAITAGAVVGIVVPLILTVCFWLRVFSTLAGDWLFFIWPSSIMLMATENLGRSPQAFAILWLSIGWNVVLYVLAFVLLWCIGWVIRAWRGSLRDGTTI
jgi:uncharacterized membrane protein